MAYKEEYLDKILNFAVEHHSNKNNELLKIPSNLEDINKAKNLFKKALEYETHVSLQEKAKNTENPILYSVNLGTDEPGIIIGNNTDKEEMLVYTKINPHSNKPKQKKLKSKSKEKIEEDAVKEMQKLNEKIQNDIENTSIRKKKKI